MDGELFGDAEVDEEDIDSKDLPRSILSHGREILKWISILEVEYRDYVPNDHQLVEEAHHMGLLAEVRV